MTLAIKAAAQQITARMSVTGLTVCLKIKSITYKKAPKYTAVKNHLSIQLLSYQVILNVCGHTFCNQIVRLQEAVQSLKRIFVRRIFFKNIKLEREFIVYIDLAAKVSGKRPGERTICGVAKIQLRNICAFIVLQICYHVSGKNRVANIKTFQSVNTAVLLAIIKSVHQILRC